MNGLGLLALLACAGAVLWVVSGQVAMSTRAQHRMNIIVILTLLAFMIALYLHYLPASRAL